MNQMINDILNEKALTKYRLSKLTGLPYTTINDICSGKADFKKCSAETVYKIAKALDVTMEELLEPYLIERLAFELFKSNVCHRLKEMGDVDFLIDLLESKVIFEYYERKWYPESLYLLAMLDYLSRENAIPICREYDELRKCKLTQPVFPASVLAMSAASGDEEAKKNALKNAIPEFLSHNIIEGEVRNVV